MTEIFPEIAELSADDRRVYLAEMRIHCRMMWREFHDTICG